MALQNRVTPHGAIVADPARGAWMGNRGCLHDASRRLVRAWKERRWIVCRLSFNGRRRTPMTPNRYTELFFLDEATALAAGHRPCAECRREDYNRFRELFAAASNRERLPTAGEMDAALHAERMWPLGDPARRMPVDGVPDGAMVALPEAPDRAFLKQGDTLRPWSLQGYGAGVPAESGEVLLITPPTTAAILSRGYAVQVDGIGATTR